MHLDKQNFYDFIHYIDPCIGIGMAWEYCDSLEKVFLKKKKIFYVIPTSTCAEL